MKRLVLKKGVEKDNISIIHVLAKEESIEKQVIKRGDKFSELKGKLVITYMGNLGRIHSISEIKDLIKMVNENGYADRCCFVFVIRGVKEQNLRTFVSESIYNNVHFYGYLDDPEYNSLLMATHFQLITLSSEFNGISVPSKFFAGLYSGTPTIYFGPKSSEIYQLIEELGAGLCFENNNAKDCFKKMAMFIEGDSDSFGKSKKSLIELYNNIYSSSILATKYQNLIESVQ
ncbi:MAG: hypothetical protein JXQ90_11530 [Cyclobacteriaceae bacterium]